MTLARTRRTVESHHKLLKTVRNFGSLCVKYSCETDTVKKVDIDVHQANTEDHQNVNGHEPEYLPVVVGHDAEGLSVDVGLMYIPFNHQLYYMPNFSSLNSLSEYTMDFALNRNEQICLGIIVYHAGVAVKLGCLKLKSGLLCMLRDFATIYTLAECTGDLSKYEKASVMKVHHI